MPQAAEPMLATLIQAPTASLWTELGRWLGPGWFGPGWWVQAAAADPGPDPAPPPPRRRLIRAAGDTWLEAPRGPGQSLRRHRVDAAAVTGIADGAWVRLDGQGGVREPIGHAAAPLAPAQVGRVVAHGSRRTLMPLCPDTPWGELPLAGASGRAGEVVVATVVGRARPRAEVLWPLTEGDDQVHAQALAAACGAAFAFSARSLALAATLAAEVPSALTDLRSVPFVTIDPRNTEIFDQAIHLEQVGTGYVVRYAIADGVRLVPAGSALDAEAQRRGATTYLAHGSRRGLGRLPMLPRELERDAGSLRASVPRSAFVATLRLDQAGEVRTAHFARAVIESRSALSHWEVQRFFDHDRSGFLIAQPYSASLSLLREVGTRLVARAMRQGCVFIARAPERIQPPGGRAGAARVAPRGAADGAPVRRWSDHLSVAVNEQVARHLAEAGLRAPYLESGPLAPARDLALRRELAASGFPWRQGVTLRSYLASLPETVAVGVRERVHEALPAARFVPLPAGHIRHGVAAYVHFTAPLRRYEDVLVHRILAAHVVGDAVPYQDDAALAPALAALDAAHARRQRIGERLALAFDQTE